MILIESINGFNMYYYNDNWQFPVITEYNTFKLFYEHCNIPDNYFAFPWATLIDKKYKKLNDLVLKFKIKEPSCFTVMQSIHFRKYLDIIKSIGITCVFTPHKIETDDFYEKKYNIKIIPYSLFPIFSYKKSKCIPINTRPYLSSFIGQWTKFYISNIRIKIFDIFNDKNRCKIIRRHDWHFNDIVFKNKNITNKIYEDEYISTLENSKFSLCPSGSGPNSIRIWESMSYGTIPIILSDKFILPIYKDIDWNDYFIIWKENNIHKLYEYLIEFEKDTKKMERMSKNNILLFNCFFSEYKMINTILEYYH